MHGLFDYLKCYWCYAIVRSETWLSHVRHFHPKKYREIYLENEDDQI